MTVPCHANECVLLSGEEIYTFRSLQDVMHLVLITAPICTLSYGLLALTGSTYMQKKLPVIHGAY
jgi:hypothetical protein